MFLPKPKPSPVQLRLTLSSERELRQHRRFNCARYAGCLDASVKEKWESFSCERCPLAADAVHEQLELTDYAHSRRDPGFVI